MRSIDNQSPVLLGIIKQAAALFKAFAIFCRRLMRSAAVMLLFSTVTPKIKPARPVMPSHALSLEGLEVWTSWT